MIFNGKTIREITDDEIDALVQNHEGERQHLEFKITIEYRDDEKRLEFLRDVVSLANGGGGYVIVGIRDDGKGHAQKYEPVGNAEGIRKSIQSSCQDHISERIRGLEVVAREVKGNPLVIVRVPVSERVPHMVFFQERTDFWTRYHDGKRAMTIGEIREAFSGINRQREQLNEFNELRKEIDYALNFYAAEYSNPGRSRDTDEAQKELRRLASRLTSDFKAIPSEWRIEGKLPSEKDVLDASGKLRQLMQAISDKTFYERDLRGKGIEMLSENPKTIRKLLGIKDDVNG